MLDALASDFTGQATSPLKFDPTDPLPPTTATVKPATLLIDRQTVTVSGSGFRAGDDVEAIECVVANFSCGPGTGGLANGNGGFSTRSRSGGRS